MRFGHIVERVDTPAEFEKEVCTERYQAPEWKLIATPLAVCQTDAWLSEIDVTYDGDDLVLDLGAQRDELQVDGEV